MYTCGDFGCCHSTHFGVKFESIRTADDEQGRETSLTATKTGIIKRSKGLVYYSSWANFITQIFGVSSPLQVDVTQLLEKMLGEGEMSFRFNIIKSLEEIPGTEMKEHGEYYIPKGVEMDARTSSLLEKKINSLPETMTALEGDGNIIVIHPKAKQLELYLLRK